MEPLTEGERKRVTDYLAETCLQVMQTVRNLSDLQLGFKPKPDIWSISENVEHLAIVDNLTLSFIEKTLGSSEALKESAWKGRDDDVIEVSRSREVSLRAPEIILPSNVMTHQEVLHRFEAGRDRMIQFATTTDASLRSFCFAHPVCGMRDCYQ